MVNFERFSLKMGRKGQVFVIAAVILSLMFMAFRPQELVSISGDIWRMNLADDLERESQRAVNIAYFNSTNSSSKLLEFFLLRKGVMKTQLMELDGYFVLFYPDRTYAVGNYFDSNISGTLNISGETKNINVAGRRIQRGNFSNWGTASLGLSTPQGTAYRTIELKENLDKIIEFWITE